MVGRQTMTDLACMADRAISHLKEAVMSKERITDTPTDVRNRIIDHIIGLTRISGIDHIIGRGRDIIMFLDRYMFILPLQFYTHHHRW